MIAMIYRKQLRISSATNKDFSQGKVINFVQVDAAKIMHFSEGLVGLTRYPLIFVICFSYLYSLIGLSFLSGLGVFGVAFAFNIVITKIQARL
jgi:hypothetical protein